MSIYTNLIEQTKREIEELEKNRVKQSSFIILQKNKELQTLQLADKMQDEFVEKLKKEVQNELPYCKCCDNKAWVLEKINTNGEEKNGKTTT
jgi:hypothetical protein